MLARHGLPRDLFYLAMIESGFESAAKSRVGAGGVWQFMPGAARAYGLEVSYWVDARRDPERAAEAAARYLKDLYVRFGSWHLVFAAYNAGYGAVLRSITNYNTNDYWELVKHESGLPWESSLYVPKILAAAIVGRNQAAFGFGEVTPDAAVRLRGGGSARGDDAGDGGARGGREDRGARGAEPAAGARPDAARSRRDAGARARGHRRGLRGEHRQGARGADKLDTVRAAFRRDAGRGRAGARHRGARAAPPERREGFGGAARGHGDRRAAPKREGRQGQGGQGRQRQGRRRRRDVAAKPAAGGDDETILVAVPDRSFSYEGRERVFYRTRDGDSLDEIADAFGVRSEELCEWNNVDPSAKLHPKMVLQVFVRKDFDPAGVLLLDPDARCGW